MMVFHGIHFTHLRQKTLVLPHIVCLIPIRCEYFCSNMTEISLQKALRCIVMSSRIKIWKMPSKIPSMHVLICLDMLLSLRLCILFLLYFSNAKFLMNGFSGMAPLGAIKGGVPAAATLPHFMDADLGYVFSGVCLLWFMYNNPTL